MKYIISTSKLKVSICLIAFLGCNDMATEPNSEQLVNTEWKLELFYIEGDLVKPPDDQPYTIQFNMDSTITGIVDCNYLSGDYIIISDDSIKMSVSKTEMACNKVNHKLDEIYMRGLGKGGQYKISGNKLYINFDNNSALLFNRE